MGRILQFSVVSFFLLLLCAANIWSAPPEFCMSESNADAVGCFATHPPYCNSVTYADRGACFLAHPEYCQNKLSADKGACFASHPDYCVSDLYAYNYGDRGALFRRRPGILFECYLCRKRSLFCIAPFLLQQHNLRKQGVLLRCQASVLRECHLYQRQSMLGTRQARHRGHTGRCAQYASSSRQPSVDG